MREIKIDGTYLKDITCPMMLCTRWLTTNDTQHEYMYGCCNIDCAWFRQEPEMGIDVDSGSTAPTGRILAFCGGKLIGVIKEANK